MPLTNAQLDALANEALPRPCPWRRNGKGNLCRRWGALLLTVYRRRDGRYGYCLAPRSGPPRWGTPAGYATEEQAVTAVGDAAEG